MGLLTDREGRILAMRFGLGGREKVTLDAVGAAMGISKERAASDRAARHRDPRPWIQAPPGLSREMTGRSSRS